MKSPALTAVSLLLNLVLLAAVVWKSKSIAPPPAARHSVPASPATSAVSSALGASASGDRSSAKPAKLFNWELVESEDYRQYIANLRSIGCPEETIRDIIVADVNKLFEARRAKLASNKKKVEYWKASSMMGGAMPDEETIKQRQELNREKRTLLTELLGAAPEEKPDPVALLGPLEAMFDFLPPGKQSEVFDAMQRFQSRMMKNMGSGMPDQHDLKKMVEAQKEMDAELARIMSPREFEDYQLRLSNTAMTMRMQLGSFDPSEDEFKKIFKLRKEFDDEFNPMLAGTYGKEESEKRQAAEKAVNDKVKEVLGEERFTEYTRSQDYNFQGMAKVAERFNLPEETAVKVYDMKKIAEAQVSKLHADPAMDQAKRTAALQAIRAETERALQETFGSEAYQSYVGNPMARIWLDQISAVQPPQPIVVPAP